MPMAVLINSDTAGYGELFACDLKDFGKAFLIGEKTAGRADVQETFELSDGGAVVLTTSKMLPYISESFDGKGLTPDTEIILADSLRENLSTLEKRETPSFRLLSPCSRATRQRAETEIRNANSLLFEGGEILF